MDLGDLEGTAEAIARASGAEPDERPKVRAVVALVGARVEFGRGLWGDAELVRVHEEWRMFVKHGLPPARRLFATFHEFAERWLQEHEKWDAEDSMLELAANYVAAALVVPRRALQRAQRHGMPRELIAREFIATQTHVALRESEISGAPRAVVTPARVYARGAGAWDATTARRLVRHPPPHVVVQRLSDDPRRWVVDPTTRE